MSHFVDRLNLFGRAEGGFSDGHGVTTREDCGWEDAHRNRPRARQGQISGSPGDSGAQDSGGVSLFPRRRTATRLPLWVVPPPDGRAAP